MKIKIWSLSILFPILFPQDALIGMHLGTFDAAMDIEYKIAEQAFISESLVIDNYEKSS